MKRDPNLFEAFKDAAKTPVPQQAPVARSGRRRSLEGLNLRWILIGAGGLAVVFLAGLFAGGGSKEVAAKDASDPVATPSASWQPAGPAAVKATRPPVAAKNTVSGLSDLYNPENHYTVLAITYSDVPSLQGRARDIAEFLRQHDLPAYEPIARAGNIEILVGAAETQGALQELTAKLRGTRGPTGRSFDFQSAFVVNIDDHLDRD